MTRLLSLTKGHFSTAVVVPLLMLPAQASPGSAVGPSNSRFSAIAGVAKIWYEA